MLINSIDISKYNARVLDVNIQNSSISNLSDLDIKNKLLPLFLKSKVALNHITVTLLINSLDKRQYYLDKSNLLSNMLESFDIYFKDRNLKFKCVLVNQADQPSLRQIRGRFQLTFIGYNLENEVIETINRITSKTIDVTGNIKVPIKLEITPVIDMIDIKINGFSEDPLVIRNLKGNKTIIIDGIEGTVTQDGINKFNDTDIWEFPFLLPGKNNILLSKDTCNITIKYNPRYI
ncbi:phage distal tail protein [Paraclostridium bifermentans]|uniref:phage distal tail protein n=1 Tax=Paraclostridium bifermentans TaxID=1490 RepID=UPI003D2BBC97